MGCLDSKPKIVVLNTLSWDADHPEDNDHPITIVVSWEDFCWLKNQHEYFTSSKMFGRRPVKWDYLETVIERSKRVDDSDFPLVIDGSFHVEYEL